MPDSASGLAADLGIEAVNWKAPELFAGEPLANLLEEAGFPVDEEGRILIPGTSFGNIQLAYNPHLRTPMLGLRNCMYHIVACMTANRVIDECVAAMPRCVSEEPWQGGDPAGDDCCPEACLAEYFQARAEGGSHTTGLYRFFDTACYPGVSGSGGGP